MRILFRQAAAAAALILLPLSARAEVHRRVSESRPEPAYLVIDRLIAQRLLLSLDSTQVENLMKLRERLQADKGRLKNVGGRGPKSVTAYVRVFPTSKEALRLALDLLTPEQRVVATRLLQAPERPQHHAEAHDGNVIRG